MYRPEIRRAGPGDVEAITSLTRQVYAKWIPLIGREPKPMQADYAAAARQHRVDVIDGKDGLAGVIEMIAREDHLLIENIAVAEAAQSKGVGTGLLAHAEATARAAGLAEVRLYTNACFTSNLVYYLKRGFEESGRTGLPDGGIMVHFRKRV
jgi:N-acetylglutamate synthase-like GNAT family acetyltransferase